MSHQPLIFVAALVAAMTLGCAPQQAEPPAGRPLQSSPAGSDRAGPVPATPPLVEPVRDGDPAASDQVVRFAKTGSRERLAADTVLPGRAAVAQVLALPAVEPLDRERYAHVEDRGVRRVSEQPVSTFSIDVDTGAYSNLRRMLNEGRLPPRDAVRVEELINYFSYADSAPESADRPFAIHTELGPNPWNGDTRLLRIGIRAWQKPRDQLLPANLVFLIDVSGSMRAANKLDLLKRSLRLLSRKLDADDRVSIVVYAGASGVVLEPTPGNQAAKIEQALAQLQAGGSTNGGAGIRLAYAKAREAFIPNGVNRVLLATDGDFNVGTVNHQALIDLIEQERAGGIALTTLGFGGGNYNDHLMEQLADHGNGNYAYIDTLLEAQKVLVDELGATLQTVARDVKIQIEFNPAQVAEYRLIGYENRALRREDFDNDRVDAGEIGAGHSVVALYEIALADGKGSRIAPLRYAETSKPRDARSISRADELAHLRLRFKRPGAELSELIEQPLYRRDLKDSLPAMSDDYRFAAAVAGFGQKLRGGRYLKQLDYAGILALARAARGGDPNGLRSDFLRLVKLAESLAPTTPGSGPAVGVDDQVAER